MSEIQITSHPRRTRRTFSSEQKQTWIQQFKSEGGSASAFAKKHDLPYACFLSWIRQGSERFVPVDIIQPQVKPTAGLIQVSLANGRKLEVLPGFDREAVRELILLLEGLC